MYKILTIVGARPQFIKAAAISHVIRDKYADSICEDILHTGQHYDDTMSGRFFCELDIPLPKYNLGVGSCSHGAQTAAMLKGIEEVLLSTHYDGVLVYGDTNSTLAGALAAAKLHVPVYHVEAGLRSFNRDMPEEKEDNVVLSGDVMLDNALHYSSLPTTHYPLSTDFILATIHRDFNTDHPERLKNILSALNRIAEQYNTKVLFPIHPRTRKQLETFNIHLSPLTFHLVEPLSYLETLGALQQAHLVLTDSGGLQKEAYFCGKPCVILRPETEWVEIVDAGAARLADADPSRIFDAANHLWGFTPSPPTDFGDGHSAEKIIEKIIL